MRATSFPSVVLALALTLGAGLPGLRPTASAIDLQLKSMTEIKNGGNGHYVVKAEINHTDVTALIDTGATVVALSFEDAERVNLHPNQLTFDVPVATANGSVKAARTKLSRVEIDGVKVDDVDALVLPKGALEGTLLGMSFLSRLSSFKSENGVLTLKN